MNIFDIDQNLETAINEVVELETLIEDVQLGAVETITADLLQSIQMDCTAAIQSGNYDTDADLPKLNLFKEGGIQTSTYITLRLLDIIQAVLDYKITLLVTINDDLNSKLDGYSYVVKQLTSDAKLAKDEAARFTAKNKTTLNKVARLKDIIKFIILKYGDTGKTGNKKYKTNKFSLWTTNSKSLAVDSDVLDELDSDNYTNVTVKVPTKYVDALELAITEFGETEMDNINMHQVITNISAINNAGIKARLKNGEIIEGAELLTNTNVTIR